MIFRCGAAIDRHRRTLLVGAVLATLAALAARWAGADPDALATGLAVPLVAALVPALVLMFAPAWRKRPGFLIDAAAGRFRTRPTGIYSLAGVVHTTLLGILLLYPDDLLHGSFQDRILLPVVALGYLFYHRSLWHGTGLTLTGEGVHSDKTSGTVAFPWTALDPRKPPTGDEVTYSQPGLVRVTGILTSRSSLAGDSLRGALVGAALRYYLTHPAERAAIGTADGHERLLAAITGPAAEIDDDEDEPWTGRDVAGIAIVVVLLWGALIGVDVWVSDRFGDESWPDFLTHLVTGTISLGLGGFLVESIRDWRRGRRR